MPLFTATHRSPNDPEHWRCRSQEARAIAESFDNLEARRQMFSVAASFDRLAELAATTSMRRQIFEATRAEVKPVMAPAQLQVVDRELGIRADGHDPGVRFTSLDDALASAQRLLQRGYKTAEIFDRQTGLTLRRLER